MPKPRALHSHTCECCGTIYPCPDPLWKLLRFEKCKITLAAKINGQGPYCDPCRKKIEWMNVKLWLGISTKI